MTKQYLSRIIIGTALSGGLLTGNAYATETQAPPLLEDEISSFGCIVGGTGLVAAAYIAGPSEAIMLWGGGLLTPSGSAVLALSIIGGLGAAGCSIGATVAPTATWAYGQF